MDRSLNYSNGVWSVPNLRPSRAQTAASAYRPPKIRTNIKTTKRPNTGTGTVTISGQPNISSSPIQYSRNNRGSYRRPRTSSSHGNFSPNASSSSSVDDLHLSEENIYLREKIRELERSLLRSQQSQQTMQQIVRNNNNRLTQTLVKEEPSIFDPASSSHPDTFQIIEPNEIWRPIVAPRPLSPIRQFGKIETLAVTGAGRRGGNSETSISSIETETKLVKKSEKKKKMKLNGGKKNRGWSLGREFQPQEVETFEMDKHLLSEWLESYNNEQHSYRSLSTKINAELQEALVFSSKLPSPNMLMTAIACTSLDKLGVLFGRYKGILGSIRHILIEAVFEDAIDIFKMEKKKGATSNVEDFCSHETYFAALNRHKIQLSDMKQNFETLRESLTEHKDQSKKRRSTMVAEMWKNAAVKSSARMAKKNLQEQLERAELSLNTLHNSIHVNTHNSIIKMLDKLSSSEAGSVLASLMPLVGNAELTAALIQALRQRQNFSSSDVLRILLDLAKTLDKEQKVLLFPNAAKEFPNSLVHKGVLSLLKEMKSKNRDLLLSEFYGSDTESLLSLLRLVTGTDSSDTVDLLKALTSMMIAGDDDAMLRLSGQLMQYAVNLTGKSPSSVMKRLFHHLPDELEHVVHHESHARRQETGIKLPHEVEAEAKAIEDQKQAEEDAKFAKEAKEKREGMIEIETQTEDPNNIFGTLDHDKIWGGILPTNDMNSKKSNDDGDETIELTHWYEDLMKLSQKSRYMGIAPMNFSKALNLVYDTYARKITKNKVDDRAGRTRESMGSFIRNSFKKLYGIPRVVNENLVGVVHSIELFAERSRRVRLFGELCGRQQKEHISDRLSDVYLNMVTIIWPKFNKTVLKGNPEGSCKINSTQIRQVLMGLFPKRPTTKNSSKSSRLRKQKVKDFYIGSTILSTEVREELYETVARAVFEEKGLTWIDFDVFSQIVLESFKRQTDINSEVFHVIFDKFCDNQVERERKSSLAEVDEQLKEEMRPPSPPPKNVIKQALGNGSSGGINMMQAAASAKAVQEADTALAEVTAKVVEESHEHVMTYEAFEKAVIHCIPESAKLELIKEMWSFLESHRMSLGDPYHITAEHFSLVLTHWGVMPPIETVKFLEAQVLEDDLLKAAESAKNDRDARNSEEKSEKKKEVVFSLMGSLQVALKLKKIAQKVRSNVVEIPHFSLLCQNGDHRAVTLELDIADVNEKSDRGSTPLMHATWFGHYKVVQLLVNAGANINLQNKRGNTALHFAYENSHRNIIDVSYYICLLMICFCSLCSPFTSFNYPKCI
jgi:hypothetical protein